MIPALFAYRLLVYILNKNITNYQTNKVFEGKQFPQNVLVFYLLIFQTLTIKMVRPKGSKSRPQLNPANIIEPKNMQKDVNDNYVVNSAFKGCRRDKFVPSKSGSRNKRKIFLQLSVQQ